MRKSGWLLYTGQQKSNHSKHFYISMGLALFNSNKFDAHINSTS